MSERAQVRKACSTRKNLSEIFDQALAVEGEVVTNKTVEEHGLGLDKLTETNDDYCDNRRSYDNRDSLVHFANDGQKKSRVTEIKGKLQSPNLP